MCWTLRTTSGGNPIGITGLAVMSRRGWRTWARGVRPVGISTTSGETSPTSAFAMNRETRHGGILSFWSRGAQSHFSGREGTLSLGGDVRTTMVGADYAKGPLVAGLSLSHSRGLGEYAGVTGGQVASSVTGLYPWLGYKATDRVTVWGVAGYGAGGPPTHRPRRETDPRAGGMGARRLSRVDVFRMIKRRVTAVGLGEANCHTFRATGITAYLLNGGTLERAQAIAAHESPRTTKLYDRTADEVTVEDIEKIGI